MKVLVDTSVWVDFFNDYPSREHAALADLIEGGEEICTCGVIVAEMFQGLRRETGRNEIRALFRQMTFLEPLSIELYLRAAEVYRLLRRKGRTVRSTIDCLIAVIAEENGCRVLARDRDLETILTSGIVKSTLWRLDPSAG